MENKSSLIFRHWIKKNPRHTAAFEMKDTRGKNYLPFSEVKDAQIDYALAIRSDKGVLLRVQAVTEGMPDYIYMRNEPCYIMIKYPGCIVGIDPETWLLEKKRSKKKGLLLGRAKEISVITIDL